MENLVNHQKYHTLLQEAFQARREKNPAYSLRAFSRALGISPTALSKVFRYERNFSLRNLKKLAAFLDLSPIETESLIPQKIQTAKRITVSPERELADDEFRLLSDWYYFAILNLAQTVRCRPEAHWIARRLGISPLEAQTALSRLVRLRLIEKQRDRLVRTVVPVRTTTDVPSTALKKLHRQQLRLAAQSLEKVSVELRDVTSVTLAIDPTRISFAKKKIREFREFLGDLLEGGEKKAVYLLSVQLFPLRDWGDEK